MEVYKTTVNAYKRLLENPANGEVCGVPTLVGTKTRKARVRATAVVESNGSSCKLLCMPHAGMASDVDVVRVAPGDGTVVGSGGVSIRTNAEHINSEFTDGGVKGRLVAAQLCVCNVSPQSNGVLYAACDQNRKDISGYEPVDIVSSIKEGNMVVASAQAEKVTVLYKPSIPEEIDEWVEDVQEGPYGGTRDIDANSYPASHAVIWQGNNNAADYERPSGEQLTAYEEGTSYSLFDLGTTRSDLYNAGAAIQKSTGSVSHRRLITDKRHNDSVNWGQVCNTGSTANPNSPFRVMVFKGDWSSERNNVSAWSEYIPSNNDSATISIVGNYDQTIVSSGERVLCLCFISMDDLSDFRWLHYDETDSNFDGIYKYTSFNFDPKNTSSHEFLTTGNCGNNVNPSEIRSYIYSPFRAQGGTYDNPTGCTFSDTVNWSTWYDDVFKHTNGALFYAESSWYPSAQTGKQQVFQFQLITGGITGCTCKAIGTNTATLEDRITTQPYIDTVVHSVTSTTELGTQQTDSPSVNYLTLQGASVTGVNQGGEFEYSAEIQTVNVPQRLLVEFDAVYEYSGENVLTSVTANPMRGKKDILPRVHNNVFASPLSGNQRAYRRYDIDSARVGSSKRKSM